MQTGSVFFAPIRRGDSVACDCSVLLTRWKR
jgi:hypothetical protein